MKAKTKTWLAQIESGKLESNIVVVLNHIKNKSQMGIASDVYNMRNDLKMAHQSLTGILSIIADEGLITETGQIKVDGSVYTKWSFIDNETSRKILAHNRKIEKYEQWVKRGVEQFGDMMSDQVLNELQMIYEYNKEIEQVISNN